MHKAEPPRALIVFATWHGQTRRIAERATEVARDRGYVVDLMSAREARRRTELSLYDRIVVCAGVHLGRHHRDAEAFVREHVVPLTTQHSALISVSLAAAAPSGSSDRSGLDEVILKLSRRTGWWPRDVITAVGGLAYTQYNPLTRLMMKRIAKAHSAPIDTTRDHELTDWPKLERELGDVFPEVIDDRRARA